MPIFDISPAKAGTTSLAAALRMLGFRACHGCPLKYEADFMAKILQNNMRFNLLDDFDAVCGLLNYSYFQLDQQIPDAKFIYLDRNEDDWVSSTIAQLLGNDHSSMTNVGKLTPSILARLQNLGCLHTTDEAYLRRRFQLRRAEIMTHFQDKPEKLLVMAVTDGWEPLCKFLGRNAPNAPFPKLNVSDPQ